MNPRATAALVAAVVGVGLVAVFVLLRPGSSETVEEVERKQIDPEEVVKNTDPTPMIKPTAKPKVVKSTTDPVGGGEVVEIELADRPDEKIDPMDHYPLSQQGMQGAFDEMQIEFDACRAERGVDLPQKLELRMTVRRESPPAEEYGIEEGEMWGMVKQVEVIGEDAAAMKPFTDCVQDNLYDLLFSPPEQDAVTIHWPLTFSK